MIIKGKKTSQPEMSELMSDYVLDLQAFFALLQEDIIDLMDNSEGKTVEDIINDIGKMLT